MLAKETAAVADEWMTILEIQREQLPVLCVLVKGSVPTVIRLGSAVDAGLVRRTFGRLADIAQRNSQVVVERSFGLEQKVERAQRLSIKSCTQGSSNPSAGCRV